MTRTIVNTLDTCGGAPRIDGTRLTCANVVLTLGLGPMSLTDYLKLHPYLARDDVEHCLHYCSEQKCVDDRVWRFCQGCSLDTREAEPCEYSDAQLGVPEISFDETSEDDSVNVWEIATSLIREGLE